MVQMSVAFWDENGSRLNTGTSTTDKQIVQPIQLTAASTWSQTRKTIIGEGQL